MADSVTRIYRNDSDQSYVIPGLGELHAGQRLSVTSEFPPAVNLVNFPGVVDVLEEEAQGQGRDYDKNPEVVVNTLQPAEEPENG